VAGLPGWDPPGTRDAGAAAAGRPPAPPAPGGPPGPPPGAAPGAGWNPPAPASFVPPAPHLPPGMPGPAGPAGPGWGPPAGPMPGGPGFGYGYGYGPRSMRTVVRHKPGLGALLGVGGFVMLLLSLTVLPWVSAGGHDTSFSDIRKAVHQSDHLNTGGGGLNPTNTSLPPNLTVPSVPGGGGVGTPVTPPSIPGGGGIGNPVSPPSFPQFRATDAAPAVPAAASTKGDYLKTYAKGLWILVLVWTGFAVLFATLWVPGSTGARAVIGFLMAGVIGLVVGIVDEDGTVSMRVIGALATVVAAVLHFAAVQDLFPSHGGPSWGLGLWASLAGFLLIFAGCAVGTQQTRYPAP